VDLATLASCLTSTSCLVTQASTGLIAGFLLFLVAAGVTLIFGILGFVNFVHGAFYMFGAYFAYTAYAVTGSYFAAVVVGIAGVAFIGALFEILIVRRLYGQDPLLQILVCYAFILIFDEAVSLIWGNEFISMGVPTAFQMRPFIIMGGVVPPFYILLIGIAMAMAIGIPLLMQYTRYGKIIRALAQNPGMVSSLGINTRWAYLSVFILGSLLAGAAGALAAPVRSLTPGMGISILIESFIVTVIGGMGSIAGALIASILIGFVRSFGSIGFPLFTEGLIFIMMVAVLLLRPNGLLGKPMREI